MTPGNLYRLGGWSLCIGASIAIVTSILGSIAYTLTVDQASPLWLSIQIVSIVAALLFSLGLPAVYLYQARETRTMGLLGFSITQIANILGNVGYSLVIIIVTSTLSATFLKQDKSLAYGLYALSSISSLLLFTGGCLFGLATLNARVFPRNAGLILLIASIASLAQAFPIPLFSISIGLLSQICSYAAFLWMGSILVRRGRVIDIEQEPLEPEKVTAEAAQEA